MSLPERESLLAAVLRSPDDWDRYRVFADWLTDNGEDRRAQ